MQGQLPKYNGRKPYAYLVPSLADTIFLLLFLVLSLAIPEKLLVDCDTAWHITTGDYILHNLEVPKHDIFSFVTPSPRWIAFEWLSDVIMAATHHFGGLTGVVILFSFLISLTYYLLFKLIRKQSGNIVLAVMIVMLSITASSIHFLARPHIFSFIFIVVWYSLLDLYQYEGKIHFLLFPLLMLVWVNLHGAFFIGFLLCVVFFLGNLLEYLFSISPERDKYKKKCITHIIILSSCLPVSLINPNGYRNVLLPFDLMASKFTMNHIGEFLSPNFHDPSLIPFVLLLIYTFYIFSVSKKRIGLIELLLMALLTYMSLYSVRNVPLFAIIMAPILARQSDYILAGQTGKYADFLRVRDRNISKIDMSAHGYLWIVLPVAIVLGMAVIGRIEYRFNEKIKPVAAVDFLKKEHIQGNMFNEYEFGDYVIYAAYPQYRVFIDGRVAGGVNYMKEYYKVIELKPDWERILEKYKINFIFFPADSMFSKFLLERQDWRLIYSDKVANIFVRNAAQNQRLIEKYTDVKPAFLEDEREE